MKQFIVGATARYPDTFPQPLMSGYGFKYTQNSTPTQMQNGWTRKRGMAPYPIRDVQLSFRMSATEFQAWHAWVHINAYKWMAMELQTDRTAGTIGPPILGDNPHISVEFVRFTAAVSWSYSDWNQITATVSAEIEEDEIKALPADSPTEPPVATP